MAEKKSKLAEIKTKPTDASVTDFINKIPDEQKRADSFILTDMMREISGEKPVLWSSSIIGFGNKRFKSAATGREVDWLLIGFAPRKTNFSLYLTVNVRDHEAALQKLGKHKTGVGCLYFNKLADVNLNVLKEIIQNSLTKLA